MSNSNPVFNPATEALIYRKLCILNPAHQAEVTHSGFILRVRLLTAACNAAKDHMHDPDPTITNIDQAFDATVRLVLGLWCQHVPLEHQYDPKFPSYVTPKMSVQSGLNGGYYIRHLRVMLRSAEKPWWSSASDLIKGSLEFNHDGSVVPLRSVVIPEELYLKENNDANDNQSC